MNGLLNILMPRSGYLLVASGYLLELWAPLQSELQRQMLVDTQKKRVPIFIETRPVAH